MTDLFGQADYAVRLDWGPIGARHTATDVAIVVDVLSFSTSVTVAVERGMCVFPYRWKDQRAERFAAQHQASLAIGRGDATDADDHETPTLSPAALLTCAPVPRLVLPSPNGSTIAAELLDRRATVIAGCLRNAAAVARLVGPAIRAGQSVAVIAAGERWGDDDSLRPALEDHLGAGAILSALGDEAHRGSLSPEAQAAADLFDLSRSSLTTRLSDCVGGRELISKGFRADVELAAALDSSATVPVLVDRAFQSHTELPHVRPHLGAIR